MALEPFIREKSGPQASRVLDVLCDRAQHELFDQEAKWGVQNHSLEFWWLIISEEVGEIAKAVLEGDIIDVQAETIQTIALLARLVEKAMFGENKAVGDGA